MLHRTVWDEPFASSKNKVKLGTGVENVASTCMGSTVRKFKKEVSLKLEQEYNMFHRTVWDALSASSKKGNTRKYDVSPSARDVSHITSTLKSMELALGPVVRLRTRALYTVLNSICSLSCKVALTSKAVEELNFWRDDFFCLLGKPIWRPSLKIELLSHSDASNVCWVGFIVQFGTQIARGNWLGSEALCNSSFCEICAIRFIVQ